MDTINRLIIFTKYPEPGQVKTRLVPLLGSEGAAQLHRRLTAHTLAWVDKLRAERTLIVDIYFDGGSAERMASCFGSDWRFISQSSGDLGDRLSMAFAAINEPTVAIGTDCPELGPTQIHQAMNKLQYNDIVLGPAKDGGYYLIGIKRFCRPLFTDIPWGTDAVCRTTQRIASSLNLSVALLEELSDVDRPEDMNHLNLQFTSALVQTERKPMSIEQTVRSKYGAVAVSGLSSNHAGVHAVAEAFGYTPDQLASIPAEANMGLSCGNPTAFAGLRVGETVVDLGCGGGLDVLLAAAKVGPTGKAIGIDMTPEMLGLARSNAAKANVGNVEFHHSTIDKLPLADASVDCVISNCVINLATDKLAVFHEIFRVLKPGGRLAASDIALKKYLPPEIRDDLMAYVGCIAGAIKFDDYRRGLAAAGFNPIEIVDTGADLNAYAKVEGQSGCCSPAMGDGLPVVSCCSTDLHGQLSDLLRRYDINEYAASVRVYALKL